MAIDKIIPGDTNGINSAASINAAIDIVDVSVTVVPQDWDESQKEIGRANIGALNESEAIAAIADNLPLIFDPMGVLNYPSRAAAEAAVVSDDIGRIVTQFFDPNYADFATLGGGASYRLSSADEIEALAGLPASATLVTADGKRWLIDEPSLSPDMFGASGRPDASTSVVDWAAAANALRRPTHGTAGSSYNVSSSTNVALRTPYTGNGARFVVPNNGQSAAVFSIESFAEDIETVSIETANTWTGLYEGSKRIPELVDRDWAYFFTSTDAVIINRAGGGSLSVGEAFSVVSDDGHISVPLVRDYTSPFTNINCARRKIRETITIDGLIVEYLDGGGETNRAVQINRPNTTLRNCHVFVSSGRLQQGFVSIGTVGTVYERCSASGLQVNVTNYGFNSNYCASLKYVDCWASQCRRDIDAHAGKDIVIEGGIFPDGVGAHWANGLYVTGAEIGAFTSASPNVITVSGSDVVATDCTLYLSIRGAAISMRADAPELAGVVAIKGGTVIIDDMDDQITSGFVSLVDLGASANYDAGRPVRRPSRLVVAPDRVVQLGASSDNVIYLASIGTAQSVAQFPQDVVFNGSVEVDVGSFDLAGGSSLPSGAARCQVNLIKPETATGPGMMVRVKNVPKLTLFANPANADADQPDGRYDLTIENVPEVSNLIVRYGAIRRASFWNVNLESTLTKTGAVPALGDEVIGFDAEGGVFKLKQFGAVGSGLVNEADALSRAFSSGLPLVDDGGTYLIDGETVQAVHPLRFVGAGEGSTEFRFTNMGGFNGLDGINISIPTGEKYGTETIFEHASVFVEGGFGRSAIKTPTNEDGTGITVYRTIRPKFTFRNLRLGGATRTSTSSSSMFTTDGWMSCIHLGESADSEIEHVSIQQPFLVNIPMANWDGRELCAGIFLDAGSPDDDAGPIYHPSIRHITAHGCGKVIRSSGHVVCPRIHDIEGFGNGWGIHSDSPMYSPVGNSLSAFSEGVITDSNLNGIFGGMFFEATDFLEVTGVRCTWPNIADIDYNGKWTALETPNGFRQIDVRGLRAACFGIDPLATFRMFDVNGMFPTEGAAATPGMFNARDLYLSATVGDWETPIALRNVREATIEPPKARALGALPYMMYVESAHPTIQPKIVMLGQPPYTFTNMVEFGPGGNYSQISWPTMSRNVGVYGTVSAAGTRVLAPRGPAAHRMSFGSGSGPYVYDIKIGNEQAYPGQELSIYIVMPETNATVRILDEADVVRGTLVASSPAKNYNIKIVWIVVSDVVTARVQFAGESLM